DDDLLFQPRRETPGPISNFGQQHVRELMPGRRGGGDLNRVTGEHVMDDDPGQEATLADAVAAANGNPVLDGIGVKHLFLPRLGLGAERLAHEGRWIYSPSKKCASRTV